MLRLYWGCRFVITRSLSGFKKSFRYCTDYFSLKLNWKKTSVTSTDDALEELLYSQPVCRLYKCEENSKSIKTVCILEKDLRAFFKILKNLSIFNPNILEFIKFFSHLQKKGFSDLAWNKSTIRVILWVEKEYCYQTKYINDISRRVYKSSSFSSKLFCENCNFVLEEEVAPKSLEATVDVSVDAVITWVNDRDEEWQKLFDKFYCGSGIAESLVDRFFNRNEIFYSVLSLKTFAPWIRNIFIVTNCQPLDWMIKDSKIKVIQHEEIINDDCLPTFNSHVIESNLYRIPNLSNHFLYLNDDFFIVNNVTKNDFFTTTGQTKANFEPYGMVNGEPNITDPDYINAARNSQNLIAKEFGYTPTKLHMHSPYALRVDVLEEITFKFKKEIMDMQSNRFRSINDISVTSFLYHHYAVAKGQAIPTQLKCLLVNSKSRYKNNLSSLKQERVKTLCINDGGGSALDAQWNTTVIKFLKDYYL